jgi:serine O-acetyltransferase
MVKAQIGSTLGRTIEDLLHPNGHTFEYVPVSGHPLPSVESLREVVDLVKEIIFPGYFKHSVLNPFTLGYSTGGNLEKLFEKLSKQIYYGFYLLPPDAAEDLRSRSERITLEFIQSIPKIRYTLGTDVKEMYDADPAAKSYHEIIFCYPTIRAMLNHRVAHRLLQLGVPLIPRIISEMAHSETGIDIHPGAQIGDFFCIDHGTGVVIGETCIIGNHVRLYQGVTLGAKKFSLDKNGNPIKDEPRHPIVEDNVVIYSNANVLGRITIGRSSVIGSNVSITNSLPAYSKITQAKPHEERYNDGLGI